MNNKKIFIFLSVIQIIIGIYSIVFVDNVLQDQVRQMNDLIATMPSGLAESYTGLLDNLTTTSIIVNAVICIVLAGILLKIALKDNLEEKRGLLIGLNVGLYILFLNKYAGLFAIIGFIVALTIKKNKIVEKEEKTKETIPILEKHSTSIKDILLGIGFILIYFSDHIWGDYIPKKFVIPVVIGFELLLIILAILIYYKDLKRDVIELKNNFNVYFKYALKTWGMMLLGVIACAIVLSIFTDIEESVNQQLLKELPLLYVIPSAIIMAPIVEETIFRGVLRKIIRYDTVYIIISGIAFGLIHVVNEASLVDAIKSSITYVVMGMFMARCYVKTNNITINMMVHAMQNTMACIFTFLI